jgi:hypothetical protein
MERRFMNRSPSGRSHRSERARSRGDWVTLAARPKASPAHRPTASETWLPIGRTILFPGTMITGRLPLRNR